MHTQHFEIPGNSRIQDWFDDPFWESVKIHRYWFAVSVLISIGCGFLFLRYKTPRYLIKASLLVRDDSKGSDFQETALLESLGLPAAASSVENETEILKSRTLLAHVIGHLNLHHQYFAEGDLKTSELYEKRPFNVRFINQCSALPGKYRLHFDNDGTFVIQWPGKKLNGNFGDTLRLPQGIAIISKTSFRPSTDREYTFVISRQEDVIDEFARAVTISPANKTASLVNLSVRNVLPVKGEAFLKRLIFDYQKASIEDKNKTADNTIAFINSNLNKVSSELSRLETDLESFRRHNRITDIREDNRRVSEAMAEYASEEKALAIRLKVIEALEVHIAGHPESIIPSSLYRQEGSFVELAAKYIEMQLSLAKELISTPGGNPAIKSIENQIITIRQNLDNAIRYQKQELTISAESMKGYQARLKAELGRIPARERQLLSKSREQSIQQELYLFLLKKRMETAISRSSHIPVARVVDPPQAGNRPVTPDRQLTMLISVLLGMASPLAILYIKQALNNRIGSKSEILEICHANIIGEISQQRRQLAILNKPDDRSLAAEQFRTLRTNIQFLSEAKQHKVVMVTSAMAGEGKSFIAARLGHSFALSGKKVLLIDFDVRKPSLARNLGLDDIGITDFLTGRRELHIQGNSATHPFDFLASGSAVDNPPDLMHSTGIPTMIGELRNRYDYVIIDTPPVGLVSDARILGKYADLSLYILRQHFTFRHQLHDLKRIIDHHQLPDIQLVLNGAKYLHTYQYSYYTDERKVNSNTIKHLNS